MECLCLRRPSGFASNDKVLPKTAARYVLQSQDGTDTGVNPVNKQLLNVVKHVGLEPSVTVAGRSKKMTIYGVHSFRHGFASHCAETGVPRAVCASILGADATIIDTYDVHIGEEAQEKAILSISDRIGGTTARSVSSGRGNHRQAEVEELRHPAEKTLRQ